MSVRLLAAPAVAVAIAAAACGGSTPPAEDHSQHPGGARVFFVEPVNGATVKSPVQFVFGSEEITIAAVPPGELTEADVRPDTVHFHLGVNTDCLPPGQVIPKADPWIHFGDGKNTIEMQMPPGEHKFAVQAGDDRHATTAGLCETITVTVEGE